MSNNVFIFPDQLRKNIFIVLIIGIVTLGIGALLKANALKSTSHHSEHHEATTAEHGAVTDGHSAVAEHGHTANDEVCKKSKNNNEYGYSDPFKHDHPTSITKLVVGNIYAVVLLCFWIAIAGLFFIAGSTLGLGGWHVQIQKIPLAAGATLLVTIPIMIVIFLLFGKDLFEWMNPQLYVEGSKEFDEILSSKHDYLNPTRFWIFAAILFSLSLMILRNFWNNFSQQDSHPSVKLFNKSRAISAASIVIIAMVINTFGSWDWGMSIQPHWYSTMFSWYTMASGAVTMFSIVMLTIIYLKSNNYLPRVNENHRHDIGKFMFAISVFWTYVWFSQFMLIWYANIPEETVFYNKRIHGYPVIWYVTIVLNFILPFLILMKRNAKRSYGAVIVAAFLIIIGHWFDFFLMVMPMLASRGGFGLISIGAFLTIGSIFALTFFTALSKVKDLESSTHPFIKESYQHHI
jgi:hypothetical protein